MTRRILMTLLGAVLTVAGFVLVCAAVLHGTMFSPGYFYRQMQHSGFVQQTAEDLQHLAVSYAAASGFDAEVLQPLAEESVVRQAVLARLEGVQNGEDFDYEPVALYAADLLRQDLDARGVPLTEEIEAGIQHLSESWRDEFRAATRQPLLEQMLRILIQLRGPIRLGLGLIALVLCGALAVLLALGGRSRRAAHYIASASIGTAMLCAVLPTIALASGVLQRVSISPEPVRLLAVSFGSGVLRAFYPAAVLCAVLGVVVWMWSVHAFSGRKHTELPAT